MFECVVCGICTRDAIVYSINDARKIVAFCGSRCRRSFRRDSDKHFPAEADMGEGD